MKLYLYQDIQYLSMTSDADFFDHIASLERLKRKAEEDGIPLHDEEILCRATLERTAADRSAEDHGSITPISFGSGPLHAAIVPEKLPAGYTADYISTGEYLFHQFGDPSEQGIEQALQTAFTAASEKKWNLQSETVLLRGVKEAGFYILQLLIPFAASSHS